MSKSTPQSTLEFPMYYDVDDIPVQMYIDEKTGEVVCEFANGRPCKLGKAIVEGCRITKEEYDKMKKEVYPVLFK